MHGTFSQGFHLELLLRVNLERKLIKAIYQIKSQKNLLFISS